VDGKVKIYLTGGTVRDKLLGLPQSKDIDFCVEAPSFEAMKHELINHGFKMYQERPEYVTLRGRIPHAALGDFDGYINKPPPHDTTRAHIDADFVLCRRDGNYSDSRHPDTVYAGTLYDDLKRRDFTMNAIAIAQSGAIYDPFCGMLDIKNKMIMCVGDARDRFAEDSLRILRALRFSVTKNMSISKNIEEPLFYHDVTKQLEKLPIERIREELHKMFSFDTYKSIKILNHYTQVLNSIFTKQDLWLKPTTESY